MCDQTGKTAYPRFLLAAGASGSGKTTITCGILQALKNRGLRAASFKCGPDYIDPMFHERALKTKSRNLDTFFTDAQTTRYLLAKNAAGMDVSVLEGVMGYYDGLGGISDAASAYDAARATRTPVVLIVNSRGMSLSAVAYIRGFLTYREDSRIRGVILNQMPVSLYPDMKRRIEEEIGVRVLGYVPRVADCAIESRHLGLVLPGEIAMLEERMQRLAAVLEETLDLDGLLALAREAESLDPALENAADIPAPQAIRQVLDSGAARKLRQKATVVAVARDEAFCFIYEDNLQLLRELGANIMEFSPLHGEKVPEEADGLLLYGGYPELHARELSEQVGVLADIREKIERGMPCLAECGGFMALHRTMEDMEGRAWPMAGVIDAAAYRTEKLNRFGYVELQENAQPSMPKICGHEFHYFDSTDNGNAYMARKPLRKRSWPCIHKRGRLLAGFPHLYYYSCPQFALGFLEQCAAYREEKQ